MLQWLIENIRKKIKMKLPRFGVEEWLNVHEKNAKYDIAGVSIKSLTLDELFELTNTSAATFYKELERQNWIMAGLRGLQGLRNQSVSSIVQTDQNISYRQMVLLEQIF